MKIEEKIDKYLSEQENMLFTDKENAEEVARYLEKNIKAPFVKANISKLGKTPSIMLRISLDKKETWANNIIQNSRFFQVQIEPSPSKPNLEVFAKSHKIELKFRKQKAKSKEDIAKKINSYIKKI